MKTTDIAKALSAYLRRGITDGAIDPERLRQAAAEAECSTVTIRNIASGTTKAPRPDIACKLVVMLTVAGHLGGAEVRP